jgi:hypothetical protein
MAIGQWAGRVGPLRIIALTPASTPQPSENKRFPFMLTTGRGKFELVHRYMICTEIAASKSVCKP